MHAYTQISQNLEQLNAQRALTSRRGSSADAMEALGLTKSSSCKLYTYVYIYVCVCVYIYIYIYAQTAAVVQVCACVVCFPSVLCMYL